MPSKMNSDLLEKMARAIHPGRYEIMRFSPGGYVHFHVSGEDAAEAERATRAVLEWAHELHMKLFVGGGDHLITEANARADFLDEFRMRTGL